MKLDSIKNIFRHKTPEAPQAPIQPEIKEKIAKQDIAKIQTEVFESFLSEAKDIDISGELAENEIVSVLGKNTQEFVTEKITDPQITEVNQETSKNIEKVSENKSILEKVRGLGHAAIITAMLSLGINSAFGANEKGGSLDKNKTEQGANKDKEKIFTISATSFFETDKADIKDASELGDKFDKFLASVNSKNFEEVLNEDWTVKGSSDERKTVNWNASNEELTKARNEAFIRVLEDALAKHDFSKQLSSEQIQQIKAKKISGEYPKNGAEKGVTYLTDLTKENGEKYTQEEIASFSPADLLKLYDKCRYTNFEAEVKIEKPSFSEILNYDECVILVDNSPSMRNSQLNMAGELQKLNGDKPVTVVYYSSEISATEERSNSKEAAEVMSKMPTKGSDKEKATSSAIEYLEKINIKAGKEMPSRILYICTDEGVQDAEKTNKLMALAELTNTTIKFLMFYENGSKSINIGLKEMNDKTDKIAEVNIKLKQEKANLHLAVTVDRANTLISRLISSSKGNEYIRMALEKDGIDLGDLAAAKEQVMHKNFIDLKSLAKLPQARDAINALTELAKARYTASKAEELTVETYLSTANINITALEDEKGKTVNFPI